jgi:hypothetical protein
MTCPNYDGGLLNVNNCNVDTIWDTTLGFRQGMLWEDMFLGDQCHDDLLTAGCNRQSSLTAAVAPGSGLRALIHDGWTGKNHGFYRIHGRVP